jgi:hypothetical protein
MSDMSSMQKAFIKALRQRVAVQRPSRIVIPSGEIVDAAELERVLRAIERCSESDKLKNRK